MQIHPRLIQSPKSMLYNYKIQLHLYKSFHMKNDYMEWILQLEKRNDWVANDRHLQNKWGIKIEQGIIIHFSSAKVSTGRWWQLQNKRTFLPQLVYSEAVKFPPAGSWAHRLIPVQAGWELRRVSYPNSYSKHGQFWGLVTGSCQIYRRESVSQTITPILFLSLSLFVPLKISKLAMCKRVF